MTAYAPDSQIERLEARLEELGGEIAIGIGYLDDADTIHLYDELKYTGFCDKAVGATDIVIDNGVGLFVSCEWCLQLMVWDAEYEQEMYETDL